MKDCFALVTTATCLINCNKQTGINIINFLYKYVSTENNPYITHTETGGVAKNRGLFRWSDQITQGKEQVIKKTEQDNFPSWYLYLNVIHTLLQNYILILAEYLSFSKPACSQSWISGHWVLSSNPHTVMKTYLVDTTSLHQSLR